MQVEPVDRYLPDDGAGGLGGCSQCPSRGRVVGHPVPRAVNGTDDRIGDTRLDFHHRGPVEVLAGNPGGRLRLRLLSSPLDVLARSTSSKWPVRRHPFSPGSSGHSSCARGIRASSTASRPLARTPRIPGPPDRATRQLVGLYQQHLAARPSEVPGDRRAHDPTADDDELNFHPSELGAGWPRFSHG